MNINATWTKLITVSLQLFIKSQVQLCTDVICMQFLLWPFVAQWLERLSTNWKNLGFNPAGRAVLLMLLFVCVSFSIFVGKK